jgi:hypothetical protein
MCVCILCTCNIGNGLWKISKVSFLSNVPYKIKITLNLEKFPITFWQPDLVMSVTVDEALDSVLPLLEEVVQDEESR